MEQVSSQLEFICYVKFSSKVKLSRFNPIWAHGKDSQFLGRFVLVLNLIFFDMKVCYNIY